MVSVHIPKRMGHKAKYIFMTGSEERCVNLKTPERFESGKRDLDSFISKAVVVAFVLMAGRSRYQTVHEGVGSQ